jgi:hypothetical protein
MSWEATQRRKMASLVLPPRKLKLQTSCRPKSMLKCVSLLSHFFDVMRVFCERGVNETDREVVCARSYRRLVSHPKIGFECEGVRSFKQILKIRIRWHCKEKRASWAWFALFLLLIKKCLLLFGNTGNNKKTNKISNSTSPLSLLLLLLLLLLHLLPPKIQNLLRCDLCAVFLRAGVIETEKSGHVRHV